MELLKSSTINELVKLTARRKTLLFLLLAALAPFIALPLVLRVQSGFGITAVTTGEYPIEVLNLLTLFLLPLTIFMTVSDMFASEFGDRTIRAMLVRPVSRFKLYTAKLLAAFILIGAQLALAYAGSVVAALFLPAPPEGLLGSFAVAAAAYAAAWVPMAAVCAAAVWVAQFFRNGSGALAVCILLYTAAKLTGFFYPELASYSPASYTDWHLMLASGNAAGKGLGIFSFLLGCCIVFYTLGYYWFEKKEA